MEGREGGEGIECEGVSEGVKRKGGSEHYLLIYKQSLTSNR